MALRKVNGKVKQDDRHLWEIILTESADSLASLIKQPKGKSLKVRILSVVLKRSILFLEKYL